VHLFLSIYNISGTGDIVKNIETFNRELNTSNKVKKNETDNFSLQVNLLLKSVYERLNGFKKAIIIGAGKMNDFSLAFFVNSFDNVILTDIDLLSVNEAQSILNLSETDSKKITKIRIEYTGFEKNQFFSDFKERIVNCLSFEKIDQVIENKLVDLENYRFLKEYEESADFVYISPIYTQLVYNQLLRECSLLRESGYPEHLIKYIESMMLDNMIGVINQVNKNIIKSLKEEGHLMALSDIFQLDIGSEFHLRVKNGIKNHAVMEEIYEGYKAKYGIGLGDFGLLNLDEKLVPYLSRWLIWPFDEKSIFVIKLKIYKKDKKL